MGYLLIITFWNIDISTQMEIVSVSKKQCKHLNAVYKRHINFIYISLQNSVY